MFEEYLGDLKDYKLILNESVISRIIQDQFGTVQNLQRAIIPEASQELFVAVSYYKLKTSSNDFFSAPGHAHFHPGVAGVEVETAVAEEAGVVVKDMAGEELVLLAEEVIGLLRLIFYREIFFRSTYYCIN